jgi:glycosyltransferase involved in cell wall biosynthesis
VTDPSAVSAVIPVFNGERHLAAAIESVLLQRPRPLELIVVDDGSTDGSAAVARRFPEVRYHHQGNGGIGAARNRGLALARGAFVAFLDADDVWTQGKLARQLEAFAVDPTLDIVSGHVEQFLSPELDEAVARRIRPPDGLLPGHAFGAMLIRRAAFDRVGPVSTVREKAECVDWCLRASDLGLRLRMLPDVVLRRRLHAANHGLGRRDGLADYAAALKASLDRRRAANQARLAETGHVYLTHGVVARPAPDTLADRNLLAHEAFARFLGRRPVPFGRLEDATAGARDALTVDDGTLAARDAALLARETGHAVTLFLNPFNVETGTPYWFSRLDVAVDRATRPSCRVDGHELSLSHPAGRRELRSAVRARIRRLTTEELRRDAVDTLAADLGVRDLTLPAHLAPVSPRDVGTLVAAGVRIENHGWTHLDPESCPREALWLDIARGREWLAERAGSDGRAYAVPFGESPPPAEPPDGLVDVWYLASPAIPAGRGAGRVFNRRALEPAHLVT